MEPLATIIGQQIAGISFTAARAQARLAFDRHPDVAGTADTSCDPIRDAASFDANNDRCIGNFEVIWKAYAATGDSQFRTAAIYLYSALRAQLSGPLRSRLDTNIGIMSDYLSAVVPTPVPTAP